MVFKINERNRVSIQPPVSTPPSQPASIRSTEYVRNAAGSLLRRSGMIELPNIEVATPSSEDGQDVQDYQYYQDDHGSSESVIPIEGAGRHSSGKRRKDVVGPVSCILKCPPYLKFDQVPPLTEWVAYREQFLSKFLRIEGSTSARSRCAHCKEIEEDAGYRCLDCDGLELLCKRCIIATHRRSGLHIIEVRMLLFGRCMMIDVSFRSGTACWDFFRGYR